MFEAFKEAATMKAVQGGFEELMRKLGDLANALWDISKSIDKQTEATNRIADVMLTRAVDKERRGL